MTIVRDSKPTDRDAINRMVDAHAAFARVDADPIFGEILVAEKRDKIVGMVGISPPLCGEALVSHLWVDPEFRRQIGSKLLAAAARRVGPAGFTVNVADQNSIAVAFWHAAGFAKVATQ